MAHPFFDIASFPWLRADAKAFFEQLVSAVPSKAEIVGVFQRAGGELADLDEARAPRMIWVDVLNERATAGMFRVLLEDLKAINRLRTNVAFQASIRDIEEAKPAIERRWFGEDLVLDRRSLRDLIGIMQPAASRMNVIIVRGDPKSGRSHGRMLFEQAAADRGAAAVYLYAGLISTVDELIDQLRVALMGKPQDIRPRGDSTEDAWHKMVCLDLLAIAQEHERPLWVMVDDLGSGPDGVTMLASEVKRFCDQFALNMPNPVFRRWFRLLLIGYPEGSVPTRWRSDFWREDRTTPADIEKSHVVEFLQEWASNKALIGTSDLERLADDVLLEVDATPPPGLDALCRLQRLNDLLSQKLRLLESQVPSR